METLAPLEDACTVVLLRDGAQGLETLMLERPQSSRTFGGAWVFPGGKVDPEDRHDAHGAALDDLAAAQTAGLRELWEETGQRLSRDDLVWLAQWTPNQALPRRFRTWFMLAPASSDSVVLNPHEHERSEWITPATALARHANGSMHLIAPTWVTLHHLAQQDSLAEALETARNSIPFAYETRLLLPEHGAAQAAAAPEAPGVRPIGVVWQGDEDYPGQATGSTIKGARHRLTTSSLPWIFERSTPKS